jgi:small subunit ribosomal protein S9
MVPKAKTTEKSAYFEARGSRKSSVARVRLYTGKKGVTVNDRDYKEYFPLKRQQEVVIAALRLVGQEDLGMSAHVTGGGLTAQSEAIRLGVARALLKLEPNLRIRLRSAELLTRDSREVERKKYGLRKARRAAQWAKR